MLCKPLAHCGGYTKEDHMCEYNTPFKLIERCEPDLDEKTLSRFVYSGRVRLEKAPDGGRIAGMGHAPRFAAGISALHGNPRRGCGERAAAAATSSRLHKLKTLPAKPGGLTLSSSCPSDTEPQNAKGQ